METRLTRQARIDARKDERADTIESLREQLAACQKDAERYRWIRDNLVVDYDNSYGITWSISCAPSLEAFDDVVDEAMK